MPLWPQDALQLAASVDSFSFVFWDVVVLLWIRNEDCVDGSLICGVLVGAYVCS